MRRNSAWIAALLSFIFPGLGHAYLGRRRAAIVFALPALVTTVAIGLDLLVNPDAAIAFVITPSGSMTITVLLALTGIWRVIAIVDSVLIARRMGDPRFAIGAIVGAIAVLAVIGMHGSSTYLAYSMYDASSQIFVGGNPDQAQASPSPDPNATGSDSPSADSSSQAQDFQATPFATPATASSRINILITGIDSARSRSEALNDTLLVVSVNPVDGSVAMLSMPRDVSNFPLYSGGTYHGKINSLMSYALTHPKQFPDGALTTLEKELGYLIGVPIHYYAAVNLDGFKRMINLVGGVSVVNPAAINDPKYDWMDGTAQGLQMPAGRQTLDGRMALAFVRSRQGLGDSDFTRARRQQLLLLALRDKLTSPTMLPKLPGILKIASETVRTDLPADRLDQFIKLAQGVNADLVKRFVLGPPYATHPDNSTTGGVYTLVLDMARVQKLSVALFGPDSRYYKGS